MQTHALTEWHTGNTERIGVAQVLFGGERNLADVIEALDVLGLQSDFLETLLVER